VVPDGDPVEEALREAVVDAYDVVLTTGGYGTRARPTVRPR
jgi:molybdopterin biosynthesis enzyme MoaB